LFTLHLWQKNWDCKAVFSQKRACGPENKREERDKKGENRALKKEPDGNPPDEFFLNFISSL
jgi:hypothetical protein